MATPRISENPEVEQHYLAQFAIVAAVEQAARDLWPLLDPTDLERTFPVIQRGLAALVEEFSRASITVAADHYEELRAAVLAGAFSAAVIDAPTEDAIGSALERVAAVTVDRADTVPDPIYLANLTSEAQRGALNVAQGLVADSGSSEIFTALARDREARGWARITRPGACYFCRLLATRGAVYLTERSGSFRAHVPKDGRGGVCRCTVEPLFSKHYEMTAQARADLATYQRITEEGHRQSDAMYEFRRAIEGRENGPRLREENAGKKSRRRGDRRRRSAPHGFDTLSPDQLRKQLSVLESLPDSDYRTKQMERVRNRLADLGD